MPEIKNNFLKAKMNRDLDARLIPNGEYRDAQNIVISRKRLKALSKYLIRFKPPSSLELKNSGKLINCTEKYNTSRVKKYWRGFFNKELNFWLSSSLFSLSNSLNNNLEIKSLKGIINNRPTKNELKK